MNREISEDVLRSIAEALQVRAPHLVPTIYKLIRAGLVDGPEGKLGSTVYGKLTASISWEDGEPVLQALEAIEREHGYNAVFAGRRLKPDGT